MSEADIKKLVAGGNAVIGTERTLKGLREGSIAKVYVTSNIPDVTRGDIEYYCKLGNIEIVEVELTNEQLGDLCKKNFSISVLSQPR